MSVYNGELYLREALDSILGQTFGDFEFVIVDDGSTDGTAAILAGYADPRLVRLDNEANIGLPASLNRGLAIARGEYVARIDADDVSLPQRLERQVAFLDARPEIGVLGTAVEVIDENGRPRPLAAAKSLPTEPGLAGWLLFFRCTVLHPTVMVRRAVYERLNGYNPEFLQAQDYELWLRAIPEVAIANLPEVLVRLRFHEADVSHTHRHAQARNVDTAVQGALAALLGRPVSRQTVRCIRNSHNIGYAPEAVEAARLLRDLYRSYTSSAALSASERRTVRADASRRLTEIAVACTKIDPAASIGVWRMLLEIGPQQPARWLGSMARRSAGSALRRLGFVDGPHDTGDTGPPLHEGS
jgi:hypothetical protein